MSFQRYHPDTLRSIGARQHGGSPVTASAMENATRSTPESRSRARHGHRRVRRTPNLLANTSLDENLNALPPVPPRPTLHRRQRELLQQRRQEAARRRALRQQWEEEQRLTRELAIVTNRRLDRLHKYRELEGDIKVTLGQALKEWRDESPSTFESFMVHHKHAFVAANFTQVRLLGILLWFKKDMPAAVRQSLEKYAQWAHIEAWLQEAVNRAERAEAFGDDEYKPELPEEVMHAAKYTIMKSTDAGMTYVDHLAYGSGEDLHSVRTFDDRFTAKGQEVKRYNYICASYRTRLVFLEHSSGFKIPPKQNLNPNGGSWMARARRVLDSMTVNEKCPMIVRQKSARLSKDILEFLEQQQKIRDGFDKMTARLNNVLRPKSKEYHKDRDITPDRKAALAEDLAILEEEFEEFELTYGLVLPEWRCYLPTSFDSDKCNFYLGELENHPYGRGNWRNPERKELREPLHQGPELETQGGISL